MPWSEWVKHRDYADWRFGLKSAEDLNGEDFDG